MRDSTLTNYIVSSITNMRKIESEMNTAIVENRDWRKANTEVVYNPHSGNSHVYLYGNEIAIIGDGFVKVFDGGYRSSTTKSRLGAILRCHGADGDHIYQRKGEWFVTVADVRNPQLVTEYPFENGFVFADALR